MRVQDFAKALNSDFITGVPDSLLKPFCDYIYRDFGGTHIVAANEGNAVGLAAGYYMATKKVPVVYLQNSGIGNIVNPVCSLLNDDVYGIPVIFVVGFRGEPGVKDEPQHVFQGKQTVCLLEDIGLKTIVVSKATTAQELEAFLKDNISPESHDSIAIVIRKGSLEYEDKVNYENEFTINRENAIKAIAKYSENDIILSTTGKISRELFEIREQNGQGHERDFLNVGSMGHCSSIAMAVALEKPNSKVWCIDGDGAAIMHLGAMATLGAYSCNNYRHIVLNNCAHDTVGGTATVADKIDLCKIAEACGYKNIYSVSDESELESTLKLAAKSDGLTFVEIRVKQGARDDLGRPTTTPKQNLDSFMKYIEVK